MSNVKMIVDHLFSNIDGVMAVGIIDDSGMVMASAGSGINIEIAGAGNSELVRSKLKTMRNLGLKDALEDILITLSNQYHIIRPTAKYEGVFVYVVIDRKTGNLALARRQVLEQESKLTL